MQHIYLYLLCELLLINNITIQSNSPKVQIYGKYTIYDQQNTLKTQILDKIFFLRKIWNRLIPAFWIYLHFRKKYLFR